MSEENYNPKNEEQTSSGGQAWEDVGRAFRDLGGAIAEVFRTGWNREETRQNIQKMQEGLEGMVNEIRQAIHDTTDPGSVNEFKEDLRTTVDNLADKGKETVHEVRPHLVNAMKQVNQELQKLIDRMEQQQDSDRPEG